jgi:hypothetical protein
MLKDEIVKKMPIKKDKKKTRVNLFNMRLESWDQDNLIESKRKKIMKPNS